MLRQRGSESHKHPPPTKLWFSRLCQRVSYDCNNCRSKNLFNISRNRGMLPVFLDNALKSSSSSWPTCPGFWDGKNELKLFSHKNHHLKLIYKFSFFGFKVYIRSLIFPPWSRAKTSKFFQKSFPGTWACSPKNMGIYPRFLDIVPRSVKCTYCKI